MALTFRVFVSSTFTDLRTEREALQQRVFPRLRDLCARNGARFQAIDLRWGVSAEASLDHDTIPICLDEIDRCRRVTPRPNFIVLLGERYGWRPLPTTMHVDEFDQISGLVPADELAQLEQWYDRDDNSVPAEFVLRRRSGEFVDPDRWAEVEQEIGSILRSVEPDVPLEAFDQLRFEGSATHQEIDRGALRVPDASDHVFCFFRRVEGLPDGAADYRDLTETGEIDRDAADRLDRLRQLLRSLLAGNCRDITARWGGDGVTDDHLDELCEGVYQALAATIEAELRERADADPIAQEDFDHHAFGEERARFFTGRADLLQTATEHLTQRRGRPLAIIGEAGSGKTTFMAQLTRQVRDSEPGGETIVRFVGATAGSEDIRTLLERLDRQISQAYGADETSVPNDYRELVTDFRDKLMLATADRPLVLLVDALDQLSDDDNARSLAWLPLDLPDSVRLVVSTTPGECSDALTTRLPAENIISMTPMTLDEGETVLDLWLEDDGRTLQPHQRREVIDHFETNGLPLYLKLAFEEARRWHSFTDPAESVLGANVSEILDGLFDRLSSESQHGSVLVDRVLGSLAAAKNGLSEDELIDILSADPAVLLEFHRRSPDSPIVDRLPVVVWSRLYFDLGPYLAERDTDGAILLDFYHRQVADSASGRYATGSAATDRHRALAAYFEAQPLAPGSSDADIPNLRKLAEQPYQQTMAELWDDLYETLTDFEFIECKVATGPVGSGDDIRYTGVFALQQDYRLALVRMPKD